MSTRPSFQFYPGDWQANSNLRRCTHAEKGVWVDVMCLMHDQPEYGILRWPLKEIAQAIGCSVANLKALQTKGVLKGDDKHLAEAFVYTPRSGRKDGEPVTLLPTQAGPIWYSSRMVKDEHVRTIRADSADKGGTPKAAPKTPPDPSPKPPLGEAIGGGFGPHDAITRTAPSSPSPSPSSALPTVEQERAPSVAGQVCKALRQVGMASTNPSDPRLQALLDAGATLAEIVAVGQEAVSGGKGWPWLLTVVQARRNDAARIGATTHRGALPQRQPTQSELNALAQGFATGVYGPATFDPEPQPEPETVDVESRLIAP